MKTLLHRLIIVALLGLGTITLFAVSASDNFAYSAGSLPTVSSGAWAISSTGSGEAFDVISSNVVRATGAPQHNIAYYTSPSFSADQESSATITDVVGNIAGAAVRVTNGGNGYCVEALVSLGTIRISKYVSGTRTELQDTGVNANSGAVYKIRVVGTTISAYMAGAQVGTNVTDASLASGQPGIYGRSDSQGNISTWLAADVGGGGGTPCFRSLLGVGCDLTAEWTALQRAHEPAFVRVAR